MSHLKVTIKIDQSGKEMIIALLETAGYDSFIETDTGVEAYILKSGFDIAALRSILMRYDLPYENPEIEELEERNWNVEWENQFKPVFILNRVAIRAPFHEITEPYPCEILIHPKMTFGTGHHQTTRLMIEAQLGISHRGKRILDVGTGTGILSVIAFRLGALTLDVTDTDDLCIDNSEENFILNKVENYHIHKGVIEKLTFNYQFDIILANINKNVLLAELGHYKKLMSSGAYLILSGFFEENVPELLQEAGFHGLIEVRTLNLHKWSCLILKFPDK